MNVLFSSHGTLLAFCGSSEFVLLPVSPGRALETARTFWGLFAKRTSPVEQIPSMEQRCAAFACGMS